MKTNKLFILFLILVFLLSGIVYADDIDLEIDSSIETISPQDTIPSINSRAAIVYDRNSGMILYGKNENEKRKMASTTKILTAIITIENSTLSDIVTISSKSAGTGGSRLGLHKDDKISVADLLYGLMLCSGNDAAVALAEHISGSVENFAILMNQKACEIGLNSSHFVTPHGLDNEEHYTTAYELALLTNYIFRKYVGTKSQTITINTYSKTLNNTNELLGYLDGVYGVKTGFTNGANRCLVTAVKRNNMDLICIVLGADTKKDRTRDSIELIEYAFKTFFPYNIKEKIENEFQNWILCNSNSFYVSKGSSNDISPYLENLNYEYPHWLYDVMMYFIYNMGGWTGIYISTIVFACILGIILYLTNVKISKNHIVPFVLTIGAIYLIKSYIAARAQLVTFILFVLELFFIERFVRNRKMGYAIGLLLISLLIANLHVAVWPFFFVLFLPYIAEY